MPKIVFRGKTYYSVYEMPPSIRRAYEKEREKAGVDKTKEISESPNDLPSPTVEPDARVGMRGLLWGILVALVFAGLAYLLSQFIP
jgi:hypothetical protein